MDTRPQIERALSRARVACLVGIGACAVLGGCLAAYVAVYVTRDRSA